MKTAAELRAMQMSQHLDYYAKKRLAKEQRNARILEKIESLLLDTIEKDPEAHNIYYCADPNGRIDMEILKILNDAGYWAEYAPSEEHIARNDVIIIKW